MPTERPPWEKSKCRRCLAPISEDDGLCSLCSAALAPPAADLRPLSASPPHESTLGDRLLRLAIYPTATLAAIAIARSASGLGGGTSWPLALGLGAVAVALIVVYLLGPRARRP